MGALIRKVEPVPVIKVGHSVTMKMLVSTARTVTIDSASLQDPSQQVFIHYDTPDRGQWNQNDQRPFVQGGSSEVTAVKYKHTFDYFNKYWYYDVVEGGANYGIAVIAPEDATTASYSASHPLTFADGNVWLSVTVHLAHTKFPTLKASKTVCDTINTSSVLFTSVRVCMIERERETQRERARA
jgi:hypothetical protein